MTAFCHRPAIDSANDEVDKTYREYNLKDARDGHEHLFEARNRALSAIEETKCAEYHGTLNQRYEVT